MRHCQPDLLYNVYFSNIVFYNFRGYALFIGFLPRYDFFYPHILEQFHTHHYHWNSDGLQIEEQIYLSTLFR